MLSLDFKQSWEHSTKDRLLLNQNPCILGWLKCRAPCCRVWWGTRGSVERWEQLPRPPDADEMSVKCSACLHPFHGGKHPCVSEQIGQSLFSLTSVRWTQTRTKDMERKRRRQHTWNRCDFTTCRNAVHGNPRGPAGHRENCERVSGPFLRSAGLCSHQARSPCFALRRHLWAVASAPAPSFGHISSHWGLQLPTQVKQKYAIT